MLEQNNDLRLLKNYGQLFLKISLILLFMKISEQAGCITPTKEISTLI